MGVSFYIVNMHRKSAQYDSIMYKNAVPQNKNPEKVFTKRLQSAILNMV